ncbi:hypothetical protein [Aquimarina mytili]|uniref:Uncharacterized protein n=1 Tax=Aquimarina mytili TaxID=874423 RepID=A0A937A3A9_9FLAO|nr:hypothetical protein [Aquimarina mytili]MBL0683599.1 hypothetical protein [Aquimarina mytili]
MKCRIQLGNKEDSKGVIVRRKFVPIQFKITRENQFVNASAKLPFTTNKVIGVLTTKQVNTCNKAPFTSRYYTGITDNQIEDASFLESNPGEVYTGSYPPDITYGIFSEFKWWYFAHPILDKRPTITLNGFDLSIDPKIVSVSVEGHCDPQEYYLWSGILPLEGTGVSISFSNSIQNNEL